MKTYKQLFIIISLFINFYAEPNNNDKQFYDYVDAIVYQDSSYCYVEREGKILTKYKIKDGYLPQHFYYDRYSGLININQTRELDSRYSEFVLTIWDYKNDKSWDVLVGKFSEGEGLKIPTVYGYNPIQNNGIIYYRGWEWSWLELLKDGNEIDLPKLRNWDSVEILGILSDNEIVISTSNPYDEDTTYFQLYNLEKDSLELLTNADLLDFENSILATTGKNIQLFGKNHKRGISYYWDTNWNSEGSAFISRYFNSSLKKSEYYLYDYIQKKEIPIDVDKEFFRVIWKD